MSSSALKSLQTNEGSEKQPFLAQLEYADSTEYITVQGLHGSYTDMSDDCFSF